MTLGRIVLLKCLLYVVLTECIELQHNLEEHEPRIFKILERDHKVFLKQENPQNYDQKALLDFLKDNSDFELRVNNILKKDQRLEGLKKKLVKKSITHGENTADLQYDPVGKTYFRPLVRLHREKKYDNDEETDRVNIQFKQKSKKNKKLKTKKKTSAAQHAVMHLSLIDADIEKIESTYRKNEFYEKLNKIIKEIESLHRKVMSETQMDKLRAGSPPIEKNNSPESSEYRVVSVTVMPGVTMSLGNNVTAQEYPCAIYPDDPIWNYWTYSHTIHEDECPGDQVKIGDVCSWTPPHKK